MKTFKDSLGRDWSIHLTCGSLKRAAGYAGFDIADITNGKAVAIFAGDTAGLLAVLWPLVERDAKAKGINEEQFGDGLRGECIDWATEALKEELLDFFPPQRRELMSVLLRKMATLVREAQQKAEQEINAFQATSVDGGTSHTATQES